MAAESSIKSSVDETISKATHGIDPYEKRLSEDVKITGKSLGRVGNYDIFNGTDIRTGEPVIVKRLRDDLKDEEKKKVIDEGKNEIRLLAGMRNTSICLYRFYTSSPFSLVFECRPKTLEDLIQEGTLSREERFLFSYQLSSGLFFHSFVWYALPIFKSKNDFC